LLSAAAVVVRDLTLEATRKKRSQNAMMVRDLCIMMGRASEALPRNDLQTPGLAPVCTAQPVRERGAVGIVVNAINQDGVRKGYDCGIARSVQCAMRHPVTVLGEVGNFDGRAARLRTSRVIGHDVECVRRRGRLKGRPLQLSQRRSERHDRVVCCTLTSHLR
jgi:imidazole glycerol phosphate synthase subunit HisF